MKRWALVVVALYGLAMVALTWPVAFVSFVGEVSADDPLEFFECVVYWIWLGVMLLCQACLLAVPVKVADRRPVARRAIYVPIVTTGFLVCCLAFGAICSIGELVLGDDFINDFLDEPCPPALVALAGCVLVWEAWALIFYYQTHSPSPRDVVATQCRYLMKGSILELLIAVPTHIVARWRGYCCAGFGTFFGITFGLAIMLMAFGPGVFFLYAERWRRVRPDVMRNP